MASNQGMNKLKSKKLMDFPNVNFLLKISLGLILFTIISSALVYAETVTVNVDGTSYNVEYTVDGVSVTEIEADDFGLLLITVDVTKSPGILEITLDRNFYDATFEGFDEEFFVLVDQDEGISTEIETNSQSRTLRIELPSGTEEIEIIGNAFFGSSIDEESLNDLNACIVMALQEQRIAVPSHTINKNRLVIRVAICNHRSVDHDFDVLVQETVRLGEELSLTEEIGNAESG